MNKDLSPKIVSLWFQVCRNILITGLFIVSQYQNKTVLVA